MSRTPLLMVLLAASVLVAAPAVAQSPGPSYAPIELTADDLGTWDIAYTADTPMGGRMTIRGVETNTVGCDGRCIATKTTGDLNSLMRRSRGAGSSAPWWRSYDGGPGALAEKQTGMSPALLTGSDQVAAADTLGTQPLAPRSIQRSNGTRTMRISVEYPDPDRRIVTTFAIAPDGRSTQTARIVYTRRR